MGGGDEALFYPTDDFVLKAPRKCYRIQVKSQHWQLRSLIGAERTNSLYFPGGAKSSHILKLNTETQEYETVRVLSFSPRCLVAQNGWVCCGGETGEFAAVRLDSTTPSNDVDMALDLNPDARLPIEFEPIGGESPMLTMMARAIQRSNKVILARSMRLAKDRVNCITLWFPPTDGPKHPGAYNEPVAVLANNDKTVIIVSLRNFENNNDKIEPIDVIKYPDFVNRAVISPDGRLLVALLDDPYLYIRERAAKSSRRGPYKPRDSTEWEWANRDQYLLRSQKRDDRSESRGSFAACFSSSGAYLAVATQYGTISVFDTAGFTDASRPAFITSFKSSRPDTGPGAIRDMAFCPGPYELLAWTEDRGHIGIADVRSHFVYRQILDINDQDGFEGFICIDRNSIDPRLLDIRNERDTLASSLSNSLNLASRRSQQRTHAADHRPDSPLTHEETTVLEALQEESRRRRNARATLREPGLTSRYPDQLRNMPPTTRAMPWSERNARRSLQTANDSDGPRNRETRERSSSVTRQAVNDLLGNIRDQRDQRDRGSNQALTDFLAQQQLVRQIEDRRSLLQAAASSQGTRAAGTERNADGSVDSMNIPPSVRELREQTERYREQSERLREQADRSVPLRAEDLDALYDFTIGNLYDSTRNDTDSSRRDRALFLAWGRDLDESTLRRGASDLGAHQVPAQPDTLSGLSWSQDGRILYVAAQNGIYEFHLNTTSRKYCPSVEMR